MLYLIEGGWLQFTWSSLEMEPYFMFLLYRSDSDNCGLIKFFLKGMYTFEKMTYNL